MNNDYIYPSQCELCVPVEIISTISGTAWTVELSHETECVNRPTTTKE